jgi:hypothetical protein
MANPDHLARLKNGVPAWNTWRMQNPTTRPDLSEADLSDLKLAGAVLNEVNLEDARLCRTDLTRAEFVRSYLLAADLTGATLAQTNLVLADLSLANLSGADLSGAFLLEARMERATLVGANLRGATLCNANLIAADLSSADLTNANLALASLVGANLSHAILAGCAIYGIAAWNVTIDSGTKQSDLRISQGGEPDILVDNLEVAQFLHLLLHEENIRRLIDTITSKVVLILGRFTPERKAILDAIRDELRKRDYLPVLFDFEKPSNRDITETVSTLAHMARFVIADLSDPKSIPHELAHVAPLLPSVPIMPLIVRPQKEYAMFEHFFGFRHVLKPVRYRDQTHLLSILNDKVIAPAEKLAQRVAGKRSRR